MTAQDNTHGRSGKMDVEDDDDENGERNEVGNVIVVK